MVTRSRQFFLENGTRWHFASRKGISSSEDMIITDMLVEVWIALPCQVCFVSLEYGTFGNCNVQD